MKAGTCRVDRDGPRAFLISEIAIELFQIFVSAKRGGPAGK